MSDQPKDLAAPRILVCEDEGVMAEDIAEILRALGYDVVGLAANGEEAVRAAEETKPDLILLDIKLGGQIDGPAAAEQIHSRFNIPVVFLSRHEGERVPESAGKTGPYGYPGRPNSVSELRSSVETALHWFEADRRIRQTEDRYRVLVETVPHGIGEIDAFGTVTLANEAYCKLYGYALDEMVGKSIFDMQVCETKADRLREYLAFVRFQRPHPTPWISQELTKEGKAIDVQVDWNYKLDRQGGVDGFIFIITDITQRRQGEECLRAAEERFKKAEELAGLGSWEWDIQTGDLIWSEESFRAFGYDPRRINPDFDLFMESVYPDDKLTVQAAIEDALAGRRHFDTEFRIIRPDGIPRLLHSRANILRDRMGVASKMIGMSLDITDRKKAEDLIRAQRDLGVALSAISNLDQAFALCIDTAMELSGMEAAGVYLANDDAGLDLVAHRGVPEEFLDKVKHFPKDFPEARITMRGSPVYFFESLPELSASTVEALKHEGFRASAVIPISHQGRVVCSFHLCSRKFDVVPQQTRHSLEAVASLIGAAFSRIRVEEALRESESHYRMLVETMNEGVVVSDKGGLVTYVNDRILKMSGYTREDVVGVPVSEFHDEEGQKRATAEIARRITGRVPREAYETQLRAKDGGHVPVILSSSGIYGPNNEFGGIVAVCTDITDRKHIEDQLSKSLEEKEALLREIHHRVKNNLAVVSSLLGLQSRHTKDDCHRRMFVESQDRIRSMALAYEKLYQAQNLSAINSKDYLTSLVHGLISSWSHVGAHVEIQLQVAALDLDLETGVTLGFIVTELVSNALKHAFPNYRAGKITLVLSENDDSILQLSVADDGVGLPENVPLDKPSTLGLDLVRIFCRQLRGHVDVQRDHGTRIMLTFSRRP